MYPFDIACKNGNQEIVKLMLNLQDAHSFISNKSLDYAIENGHSGVTDILLRSNIWKSLMMYEENATIRDLIQKMVINLDIFPSPIKMVYRMYKRNIGNSSSN